MRYEPLKGKEKFDDIFKCPDYILKSKNFSALIVYNENKFSLGMILPKKNIKLAVHRNYLKRTIRNLSNEIFENTKISMIVISKKKIFKFAKRSLRLELENLFDDGKKKIDEKNNYFNN